MMTVKAPWFRCFPGNFLLGTTGMRPILHKTYTRLLMGLYEAGGTLPNDDQHLKGLLELRPQDVRSLIGELIRLGKISVEAGVIHNGRTDHELSRKSEMNEKSGSISQPLEAQSAPSDAPVDAKSTPIRGKKRKQNYARADDHAHAHKHPRLEAEAEGNKALPTAESFITNALPIEVGSLRPATNGKVEGSAPAGERSLEGRSPPEPSGKVEALKPTEALLKSKLVTGLMAALQTMPKEDDDAEQA